MVMIHGRQVEQVGQAEDLGRGTPEDARGWGRWLYAGTRYAMSGRLQRIRGGLLLDTRSGAVYRVAGLRHGAS